MRRFIPIFLLFMAIHSYGNGVDVSAVSFNQSTNQLSFTLTWQNGWNYSSLSPALYDGVYVFIKYAPNGGDSWLHAEISNSVLSSPFIQTITYDKLGIMIYNGLTSGTSGTTGPQAFTLDLGPLVGSYQDFKVFATEMVFIDQGSFYAGDGVSPGRFHQGNDVNTPWLVGSELAIMRGTGSTDFNQEGSTSTQHLGADFPKGWDRFWCMKYKITAEQYVDFLNCLTRAQQSTRVQADISGTVASNKYVMTNTAAVQDRNPIACDVNIGNGPIKFYLDLDASNPPNSDNDGANIVLNHLTVGDILAYFDWSGLRPMTELEYEKMCRGTNVPAIAGEFAWGSDTNNSAGTITNSGAANEATSNVGSLSNLFKTEPLRAGFAATSTSNRSASGATFWGIMDMHNLGEFMYGVESTNFSRLSYGDGSLDANGNAMVSGWTVDAQFLSTMGPTTPGIEPISEGKNLITSATRSAYIGARGVRRLIE